jgi:integrase
MARTVNDAKLGSREARRELTPGRRYYRAIEEGLHLGYRKARKRGEKTGGKWLVRIYLGAEKYRLQGIGIADDTLDANGKEVLNFAQAQAKARKLFVGGKRSADPNGEPLTVAQACANYIEFLRAAKKTAVDTEQRLANHFLPKLGGRLVSELVKTEIEKCHWAMVHKDPDDPDAERRSQDSANRVLSMFKAAMNRAFEDESNGIPSDAAWRRVKPFKDVGRARSVHLDAAQSMRLLNAAQGAFRHLVTAALLTGARPPHELISLRVRDFHADLGTLSVDGKTGHRHIVLTKEAVRFFAGIAAGRGPDDLLLPKDDGTAWGKNHHVRPMHEIVKRAKLPKDTTIYCLRHTNASQSILAGINLKLLAENLGTSIRMLEVHYGKFIAGSRRKLIEESSFKLGLKPTTNIRSIRAQ